MKRTELPRFIKKHKAPKPVLFLKELDEETGSLKKEVLVLLKKHFN